MKDHITADQTNSYRLSQQLIEQVCSRTIRRAYCCRRGHTLVLGDYDILEEIGKGGMGQVYKARHRRMERLVAIKTLPHTDDFDEQWRVRFRREVKAAARLSHPHIVTAYDAREDDGIDYLVMEFVDGEDLGQLVRAGGPLPLSEALECILQAARGLEYAHEQGVVHRDIKPTNLLLDPNGTVKVLDMGLARIEPAEGLSSDSATDLTGTGTVMGTVDYMAPEQAQNTKLADQRSDIYSLGITLFYLLTGKPAYSGSTAMERLLAHRDQPIPSVREAVQERDDFSTDKWQTLEGIFQRMIAKKPEDRYPSMTDLIRDLDPLVQQVRSFSGSSTATTSPIEKSEQRSQRDLANFDRDTHPNRPSTSSRTAAPSRLRTTEGDTDPVTLAETRLAPTSTTAAAPHHRNGKYWLIGAVAVGLLALMSGLVLRLNTPAGEVVLTVKDPHAAGAEIRVNDKHVITIDGVGEQTITITPSEEEQTLTIRHPDFETQTESFTLKDDGGEIAITVSLNPKQPTAGSTSGTESNRQMSRSDSDDVDREVAEWVLEAGGQVSLNNGDDKPTNPLELPNEPFEIFSINLQSIGRLSDEDLRQFNGLQHVETLTLNDTPISDGGLRHLNRMKSLKYLYLADCKQIDGSGLQFLKDFDGLVALSLQGTGCTDDNLRYLDNFKNLQNIGLSPETTGKGLDHVLRCSNLRLLYVNGTSIPHSGIAEVKQPLLEFLIIDEQHLTATLAGLLGRQEHFRG
ncbi:MAG: protein kinase [Planctomycetaceae bacterium]